ncbi:MAG: chitobiase/beta-hexosaminidase C-terminal domain-containing protein, partial [Acidobacteriaceae bacterium]
MFVVDTSLWLQFKSEGIAVEFAEQIESWYVMRRWVVAGILAAMCMCGCGGGGGSTPPAPTLPVAAVPSFMPAPGSYTSAQSVTLSDTTKGASIFYTTDGSAPST